MVLVSFSIAAPLHSVGKLSIAAPLHSVGKL